MIRTKFDKQINEDYNLINNYDFQNMESIDDDSYIDLLERLRIQCKQSNLYYQEKYNIRTDNYNLFSNPYMSNIIKNEDDLINQINMNNPEEAELFFDFLQSIISRNFIENKKYENFDDCSEIEYNINALESAKMCENDINDLKEYLKKNKFKHESNSESNISNDALDINKNKKILKKKNTKYFQRNDPPNKIIRRNYNNYLSELEEKRKEEEINFKFIAKPAPSNILQPKYDNIVKQAKLRQKENVNSRLNMWKTTLKPFSFDSRDAEKQRKKIEEEALKEEELEKDNNKNYDRKKIVFRLVQTAAEDGYERFKKRNEIDRKAHLTPEHIFHPNISKDIPSIYKINSRKYKELKEKKKIEQYKREQKEIEKLAKHEKLMLQRVRLQPTITYKNTRSSILRNKAIIEKDESEKLYKDIEKELQQDKKREQLKIKDYVHDKLKDLYFRKYAYENEIKLKKEKAKKEQEELQKSYEDQLKRIYEDVNNNRHYLFEEVYTQKSDEQKNNEEERNEEEKNNKQNKKGKQNNEINPLNRFNSIIKTNGLDIDEFNVFI
ncbi:hypothetical protein BCR36DRAFT_411148 [Piromyces finnis]|uniref:Uncharacterized protein n=1 Tax=Piromyces finnis TaxID=1754191 RepID=A0A1Y1VDJ3_9FUNG|nr:hypothetical protein BCR36DRAFT_411148 [Piromyces finnis]|eukprot:ORX53373.1 hypothetical protein BCR36DRAFT_411148 [Piromyces finnis]